MFDLARRFGIRVIEVDEVLPAPVLYIRADDIAFVSSGLSEACRAEVADQLLSAALRRPSALH